MLKHQKVLLGLVLVLSMFVFRMTVYASQFSANPKTAYSKEFIEKSEGQQWFLNEIEKILEIQGNSINNINSKEDLKNIFSIGVQDKNIEGKIPKAIGELSNLRYLYASKNKITGSIPEELFDLSNLESIDLSDNQLDGDIPKNISNLSNLRVLLLWGNKLSGEIPNEIGNLIKLENLDLAHNNFTGNIPSELGNLVNLKFLALSDNMLKGNIPENISDIKNLKTLLLWKNTLTGEIPESVKELIKLENFDVSENKISGSIREIFEDMPKLGLLDLSDNLFVGDIGDKVFEKSLNDLDLYIETNYMAGENIAGLPDHKDNFLDGKEVQNRFSLKDTYNVRVGTQIDVFKDIKIISPTDGSITRKELELPYKYFDARVLTDNERTLKKIEITRDKNDKLIIKPISAISKSENVFVEVYITEDDGYTYPSVKFQLIATVPSSSQQGALDLWDDEVEEDTPQQNEDVEIIIDKVPMTDIDFKTGRYIYGYEDGTFKPNGNITREEIAYIIYAINNTPVLNKNIKTYTDVSENIWSYEAINFVTEAGIMTGYPDGSFRPKNNLTRAELTVIVAKMKGLALGEKTLFPDAIDHWGSTYINAVHQIGYMSGYPDGTFKPDNNITRAEVVSTMNRVLERKLDKDYIDKNVKNPFIDLQETHWAYYDILEATIER